MKNKNLYGNLLLTIASVFALVIFVHFGNNKTWFFEYTIHNWKESIDMSGDDMHNVKLKCWGNTYFASNYIKDYCREEHIENPVILFEPNEYYAKNKINFKAPEPVTFYYYTGLKCVWIDSKDVKKATHYVKVTNKGLELHFFKNSTQLTDFLENYSQYKTTL